MVVPLLLGGAWPDTKPRVWRVKSLKGQYRSDHPIVMNNPLLDHSLLAGSAQMGQAPNNDVPPDPLERCQALGARPLLRLFLGPAVAWVTASAEMCCLRPFGPPLPC